MLTTRQAKTIRMLFSMHYGVGSCFDPDGMFPGHEHDPEYQADMRAVKRLARDGILKPISRDMPGLVRLPQSALDAYDEWYKAKGWKIVNSSRANDH